MTQSLRLFEHVAADGPADLTIDPAARADWTINPLLFGKFCEHLGSNIYNGMEAQILRNPTFGQWFFPTGPSGPDGGCQWEYDGERVNAAIRKRASRLGLPAEPLIDTRKDGGAFWWRRLGDAEQVKLSPDVGLAGGRAQRVEVLEGTGGIAQLAYLPAHRTSGYEFRVVARSAGPTQIRLELTGADANGQPVTAVATAEIGLSEDWAVHTGRLELPAGAKPDGLFRLAVLANAPANVVLGRVLLYPDDHAGGADPDVIASLREARLPLLRWPGGNFVSAYRWRDGIGPADRRPTVPNQAWDILEPHLFGTDEFVAFCRQVGCEPMICVNAGNGSAEEAAAWVQYCNGSPDTPMGRLRAENGHPEPFGVKYWEVGNEIYGRWQVSWTTAGGGADRCRRFARAMRQADPTITLVGCGLWRNEQWNDRLANEAGEDLDAISIHVLEGGQIDGTTDPKDLYHAFMAYPVTIGRLCGEMSDRLARAGVAKPNVAVTELQLFAHFQGKAEDSGSPTPSAYPTPDTITEALYDAAIIFELARLGGDILMLTHSATVNHGGGLRKTRERVWANPAHHGHVIGSALFGARPVAVKLNCPAIDTHGPTGNLPEADGTAAMDALAGISPDGSVLHLMLVHRSAETGEIKLAIDTGGFAADGPAEAVSLIGQALDDRNTSDQPDRIAPARSTVDVRAGRATLQVPPYSLTRIAFRRG